MFNPLKTIVTPSVKAITSLSGENGVIILILSVLLLLFALRYLVINLKALVIGKVEAFFSSQLFKNAGRSFMLGLVLTVMVQSSSITTSLAVPLAGAGILTLVQIFPMTLGANVGTTITAILAAMVTGEVAAVTVAFAHLLFNISGILILWPLRAIPLRMANILAGLATRSKLIPIFFIVILFFIIPMLIIWIAR